MTKVIELHDICDYKTKYGFIIIHPKEIISDNEIISTIDKAREEAYKIENWCMEDIVGKLPKEWNAEYGNFDLEIGV